MKNTEKKNTTEKKFDLYEVITDKIIAELEQGKIPWVKPWNSPNVKAVRHTANKKTDGKPYSLLNQLLLGGRPGEYVTFKQAQREGGKIKKGAKPSKVVFWEMRPVPKKDMNGEPILKDGKPVMQVIPMLKYYNVFHIEDTEGLTVRHPVMPIAEIHHDVNTEAEAVVADYAERTGLRVLRDEISTEAFYSPSEDYVKVPKMGQFRETPEFYSTLFHELTHSTGHKTRLDRFKPNTHFGDTTYSKEELIAEIGAAVSLSRIGIDTEQSFKNSAAYIQNWLQALRNDKRLIVSAAGKAEKAVALIFNDTEEDAAEEGGEAA